MSDCLDLVNELMDKNNSTACAAMKKLTEISGISDEVYAFMDGFIEMLGSSNSYVRNRALCLISSNAKWDSDGKIDGIIDKYLSHITDMRPITGRQCISALPEVAKHKPCLREKILCALRHADVSLYPDSMAGLVQKDIQNAIRTIEKQRSRADEDSFEPTFTI